MVKSDQMAGLQKRESVSVAPAPDVAVRKRAEIDNDDKDDHNKKQKLSDSVVTTTDDGSGADRSCSDEVSILSPEDKAMMQKIRGIARGGYFEGLNALGRSIPTTNLVDWISITTIAEEILYNNEPMASLAAMTPGGEGRSTVRRTSNPRIRSVTPPPLTTHTTTRTTTTTPTRQSHSPHHSPQRADEITPDVIDLPTLAILKNEMSKLRNPKKKLKEGRWAHSIAAENIDNWPIITRSEEIDDLSVHQLKIFLQAYSYAQLEMRKSFLQKCNLQQFFVDMDAKEIESDLTTIKACLKLIQDANSDTTKIAEQIAILEGVSIVQSMIKVKKERAKSQWEVDSILTTAAAPIQELMKHPEVEVARKFVEEECLMTFAIGDTRSKSLDDIKSLNVASYPVPGKNHKQVYHNLGWMKMDCNKTMWILPNAAVCAEQFNALPKGSTKNYLACTLFVEMLPMVLDSHFAKKTGGYPFIFQALCKAFDMNVGEEYWKVINESLPNLNRNCIQLLGKHLLSSPFFPYQAGDKVLRNKHPETSFYAVKEDDCNIEMVHRQCLHVAHTLDQPYHRPTDIELLGIAQVVGMVPAADNSFKYQTCWKAGKSLVAKKLGIHDPKHRGKGGRARNLLLGHTQWNGDQIKVLLEYVITNCGSGQRGEINWSSWDSDGVEGYEKLSGQNKLYDLIRQYKRKNKGDDGKTNNDANTKQLYQIVLAEQAAADSDTTVNTTTGSTNTTIIDTSSIGTSTIPNNNNNSNSINTNNLDNPYHYIVTTQATIVSELQKTRDVLQALKIEAREREATQTHHANAMEQRLLHDLQTVQTTVSLTVDTLAATIEPLVSTRNVTEETAISAEASE